MSGNVIDWEYWYRKLMSLAHEDESMRFAINTIDEIHEDCGAFKYCEDKARKDLNWALDKLESTSDYDLFTAVEEMIDYFGFRDLEESKKAKSTTKKLKEATKVEFLDPADERWLLQSREKGTLYNTLQDLSNWYGVRIGDCEEPWSYMDEVMKYDMSEISDDEFLNCVNQVFKKAHEDTRRRRAGKPVIEKCQSNRSNKMRRLFKESAKLYDVLIVFENDGEDELFMNAAEELAPKGLYDDVSIWSDNHGAVQIYHVDITKVSAFIEAAYDVSFLSQIGCEMPREVRVYPEGELITLFA